MTAQGLDNYGSEAIYPVGASVGQSEYSNRGFIQRRPDSEMVSMDD